MSSSENVFAEVIEVAKFIDEFRGHYFALPSYQEKIDLLKDQIEHALEKLDAIPIGSQIFRRMHWIPSF